MQFNIRTGNYSQAGKSAADDTVRAFAAARRNAPDYGKMAQQAQEIRSKVKQEGIKAATAVTKTGIQAAGELKSLEIKESAERKRDSAKRKAGALATAGQMFGTAGSYLGEKRTKREVGTEDSYFDTQIEKAKQKAADLREQAAAINVDTPDQSTNTPTKSTGDSSSSSTTNASSPTTASSSSGAQAKVISPGFQGFVDMARKSGAKYPQLVAAQWALESGWGKTPSGKNNYFGIKASSGEAGTSKQTWEVYGGKEVTTSARFKDYASPQGGVDDLVSKWHKDYGSYQGVNNAPDAFAAADMLKQQGYATDPKYAEKLKKIMRDQGF